MGFTSNQWAIVALVLVLGWLLGMLSRSGGAKWRRAYQDEVAVRKDAEAQLAAARERNAELERQVAGHPVGPGTAGAIGAAAAGNRDDLALIRGIGRDREIGLNDAGFYRYRQIEALSDAEAATLETRLGLKAGTIAYEEWREQAALLRERGVEAHRTRWGTPV
jgi:predicted flap endonuclease-1-like 5' DNA nuclease